MHDLVFSLHFLPQLVAYIIPKWHPLCSFTSLTTHQYKSIKLHGWYTIDRPDNDHLVFVIDPNYAANHYDFPIDAEDKPRTKLFQNWDLTSSEAPHFVHFIGIA
eukprot:24960_1